MSLIEYSLKRSVFGWILMSALIIFGAISLSKLGISQMPDVDFPVLSISLDYPGAAPEVIENEIVDPIEQRISTVEGIKEIRSQAKQGSAVITLEFDINHNIDVALQEVQTAISQIRLPAGVDPAIIKKTNPEEEPVLFISIYGDKSIEELMRWSQNYFLDQIQFLPGVGEVSTGGFPDRNLRIWLDINKLKQYEMTVNDVVESVRSQHLESAAGQYSDGKQEVRVRYLGEARTVKEIAEFPILRRGGQLIQDRVFHIKDVADVEDGLADIQRVARVDNKTAVLFRIKKQRGTNEVVVAETVLKKLKEIKYPEGVQYRINVDYTKSTKSTVSLTIEKLWLASIITILVCFLFLGNIQSSINILFSIPTSILGTFIILYFSGFTLNLFTLLALTLSISIVVDDAIMILENIVRHYRMGKNSYQAALDGAREVLPAAIAATFAVLAVFLPVIFMDGVIGKFLFQFGIAMSAAVLLSLVEAVTITPMRAAAFLKDEPKPKRLEIKLDHYFEKLGDRYRNILSVCLKHQYKILSISFVLFAISMFSLKKIKQEFVPSQDQNIFIVTAQAPPGTALDETIKLAAPLQKVLNEIPDITGYMISIGPGAVFMPVSLKDRNERKLSHTEIMNIIRKKSKDVKGLRVSIRDVSARNLTSGRLNPVAFNLRGPDLNVLNDKSQEMIKLLEEAKISVDVDTDYRVGQKELALSPNRDQLLKKGVSADAVAQVLQVSLAGYKAGQYMADGKKNDIRFKIKDEQIKSKTDVQKLYVRNNYGNLILLSDIVKEENKPALQSINRINRQRAISVYGNLPDGKSQSVALAESEKLAEKILPEGYSFNLEGAAAGFSDSFKNLYFVLVIGIILAYMILAIQFNSFMDPISVLMSLPFSVTGALLTLWATGDSLNLFSFIGLIVLMGIAKKNAIMLIEFTTQTLNHENLGVEQSLLKACPIRLRPILMTSVATIAAALPLVLGTGIGFEARRPMGYVIIGGTLVSTVFTLFVVPLFYSLLSQLKTTKIKRNMT